MSQLNAIVFIFWPIVSLVVAQRNLRSIKISNFQFIFLHIAIQLITLSWLSFFVQITTGIAVLNFIGIILAITVLILNSKNTINNRHQQSKLLLLKNIKITKSNFALVIFSIYSLWRVTSLYNVGDNGYDSNVQHIPIALSMYQQNSISNLPQIQMYQQVPAAAHLYSAIYLFAFQNIGILQVSQSVITFAFVFLCFSYLKMICNKFKLSNTSQITGKIAIIGSAPLMMTMGIHYVDIFSQAYLLILLFIFSSLIENKKITKIEFVTISICVAIIIQSKVASTYQLAPIFFALVIGLVAARAKIKEVLMIGLVFLIGTVAGSLYFLRNFQEFRNPLYPYSGFLNFKAQNYLVDYNTQIEWLKAAAPVQIKDANPVTGIMWNWFGSDLTWLQSHVLVAKNLMQGTGAFSSFGTGSVYALDARVSGNGITISVLILLGLLGIFTMRKKQHSAKISFLTIALPFCMAISIPNPPSLRYTWAAAIFLAIYLLQNLDRNLIFRNISFSLIFVLSAISVTGTVSASYKEINYVKNFKRDLGSHIKIQPIYSYVQGPRSIAKMYKCPKVLLQTPASTSSFASGLWIGGSCTQVRSKDDKLPTKWQPDFYARFMPANSKEVECINKFEKNQLILKDAWNSSFLIFDKSFMDNQLDEQGECLLND